MNFYIFINKKMSRCANGHKSYYTLYRNYIFYLYMPFSVYTRSARAKTNISFPLDYKYISFIKCTRRRLYNTIL